eukprot:5321315-Pleurochrysis_carterae.AAC.1
MFAAVPLSNPRSAPVPTPTSLPPGWNDLLGPRPRQLPDLAGESIRQWTSASRDPELQRKFEGPDISRGRLAVYAWSNCPRSESHSRLSLTDGCSGQAPSPTETTQMEEREVLESSPAAAEEALEATPMEETERVESSPAAAEEALEATPMEESETVEPSPAAAEEPIDAASPAADAEETPDTTETGLSEGYELADKYPSLRHPTTSAAPCLERASPSPSPRPRQKRQQAVRRPGRATQSLWPRQERQTAQRRMRASTSLRPRLERREVWRRKGQRWRRRSRGQRRSGLRR